MRDLRADIDRILDETGNYILFIRLNNKIRCTCWNELYGTPFSNCPKCLGTGYLYQTERHLTRSIASSSATSPLPNALKSFEIGDINGSNKMFYLKDSVLPKSCDLIIECGFNEDVPVIDDYSFLYEISFAQPFRCTDGRIEYFRAACKNEPINATLKLTNITNKDYIAIDKR